MKYIIIFISLLLLSCAKEKQQTFIDLCPKVFFSKEHRLYVTTEENSLTLNNISYKAKIDNYTFSNGCFISNHKIIGKLSILFVITPIKIKQTNITIPYYIALLDNNQNIEDIQYYQVKGTFEKDNNESSIIETEIITIQDVITPFEDVNKSVNKKFLIGFMLNQEKLNILN